MNVVKSNSCRRGGTARSSRLATMLPPAVVSVVVIFQLYSHALAQPRSPRTDLVQATPTHLQLSEIQHAYSSSRLDRRKLPDPEPCQGMHWVGRFCEIGIYDIPTAISRDVCWRTALDGRVSWSPTWFDAQYHGHLNLARFDQELFLPGVLSTERIPTFQGTQIMDRARCPDGMRCLTVIDPFLDPHVMCETYDRDVPYQNRFPRYMKTRAEIDGRYMTLVARLASMRNGVQQDQTPNSPGPSQPGSPVRGRPLAAVYTVENDVKDASLSTLVLKRDGTPLELTGPLFATLVPAAEVGLPVKGTTAPGELLCTSSSEHPDACYSQQVHDYHKGDELVVHFDAVPSAWVNMGAQDLAIYTTVAHVGKGG